MAKYIKNRIFKMLSIMKTIKAVFVPICNIEVSVAVSGVVRLWNKTTPLCSVYSYSFSLV